jgi:hypothetical protein
MGQLNILLAEDNAGYVLLIRQALRNIGSTISSYMWWKAVSRHSTS